VAQVAQVVQGQQVPQVHVAQMSQVSRVQVQHVSRVRQLRPLPPVEQARRVSRMHRLDLCHLAVIHLRSRGRDRDPRRGPGEDRHRNRRGRNQRVARPRLRMSGAVVRRVDRSRWLTRSRIRNSGSVRLFRIRDIRTWDTSFGRSFGKREPEQFALHVSAQPIGVATKRVCERDPIECGERVSQPPIRRERTGAREVKL
jgi:hypothetical protein